jgi:hypothetical protein
LQHSLLWKKECDGTQKTRFYLKRVLFVHS